jgi:hypothetical protein
MGNWIQNVIGKWTAERVKLNPPVSIAELESTESILNFKFPNDFKEFYLQANGFYGLDWQEHMFTFWPLEMIVDEFKGSTNNNFIGFCDFLLASHYIGFNRNRPGIFKSYRIEDGEQIADTFEEIVSLINSNSEIIY